jgi:hypothetical protein
VALYDDAVKVAKDFVGPAGELFIQRQIATHLKLAKPRDLAPKDITQLALWCKVSFALLANDARAEAFRQRILSLL